MTGSYWTPQEISVLSLMWRDGKTTRQIAMKLPGRNRNMVIGKARRIGLDPRPSPIIRKCAECEIYTADFPSKLCPSCQAYQEHQQ